MANSDNSSPPPVEPVDQLAELRRKRGSNPGRPPAPRSSRRPTTDSDRNRFTGADALNGAGPLGAGLGPYLDFDDVDDALDAITTERERTPTATSELEASDATSSTDIDSQLETAVTRANDDIRDGLRHHHERERTRNPASTTPHGSADLEPQPKRAARRQPSARANKPRRSSRGTATRAIRRTPRRVRWLACVAATAVVAAVVVIATTTGPSGSTHGNSQLQAGVSGVAGVHHATSELHAGSQGMDPRSTERTKAPPPQLHAHALANLGVAALTAAPFLKRRHPHHHATHASVSTTPVEPSQPSETTTYQPAETTTTPSYTPTTTSTTPAPTSGGGGSSSGGGSGTGNSSSANKTPDYGPTGALGPGSSPDG